MTAKIVAADRALGDRAARATPGWRVGQDEVRQQRHGQPAGDEREADRRVVGPVADVRLEAAELAARALGHLAPSPCPSCPVAQASPASSASGTALACRAGHRVARRQQHVDRVARAARGARGPAGSGHGLVLPLVAEHEVDVAERERRQRLLGLGLDELAPQARRVAGERLASPGIARCSETDWNAGDAAAAGDRRRRRRRDRPRRARPARAARRRARRGRAPGRSGARRARRARAAARRPRARASRAAGRRPTA